MLTKPMTVCFSHEDGMEISKELVYTLVMEFHYSIDITRTRAEIIAASS